MTNNNNPTTTPNSIYSLRIDHLDVSGLTQEHLEAIRDQLYNGPYRKAVPTHLKDGVDRFFASTALNPESLSIVDDGSDLIDTLLETEEGLGEVLAEAKKFMRMDRDDTDPDDHELIFWYTRTHDGWERTLQIAIRHAATLGWRVGKIIFSGEECYYYY